MDAEQLLERNQRAAHPEDELSLTALCYRKSWSKVLARIKQLPTNTALAELFYQDEEGFAAFIRAASTAPVEVFESMILLGKLGAEKRNILGIANMNLYLPVHLTAQNHPDSAAIKLLICHYPQALLIEDGRGNIPLDHVEVANKSPANMSLLRKLTTAYKHGLFSALVRLCGTSDALQALAVRSTDDVPLLVLCQCCSWVAAAS